MRLEDAFRLLHLRLLRRADHHERMSLAEGVEIHPARVCFIFHVYCQSLPRAPFDLDWEIGRHSVLNLLGV